MSTNNIFEVSNFTQYDYRKLFSSRISLAPPIVCFYALEGMQAILNFKGFEFIPSIQKLLKDVSEYKEMIAFKFSQAIYDYTVMVCFAESRYIVNKISKYSHIKADFNKVINDFNKLSDRASFKDWAVHSLEYTPKSIADTCKILFGELKWNFDYGGECWENIAKTILMFHSFSPSIFVDHCIDLHHNCGIYLDKGCDIFDTDVSYVEDILIDKFMRKTIDFIYKRKLFLDSNTIKLVHRFLTLMKQYKKELPCTLYYEIDTSNSILLSDYISSYRFYSHYFKNNQTMFNLFNYKPKIFGEKNYSKDVYIYFEHPHTYEKIKYTVFEINKAKIDYDKIF